MTDPVRVREVAPHQAAALVGGLADLLIACVDAGASVSFMAPLSRAKALAFWEDVAARAVAGRLLLVVAEDADGTVVGTAQVITALPENQPHRGDLAKMLVSPAHRRRGLGERLLRTAEDAARRVGKTLLVLDTASDSAERLYARAGWTEVGRIPDFALLPDGSPCATTIFYKRL